MLSPGAAMVAGTSPTAWVSAIVRTPIGATSPTATYTVNQVSSPYRTQQVISPQPLSRSTLLNARRFAQRVDAGPPGLSMFAPTPKTNAVAHGFCYPQPG